MHHWVELVSLFLVEIVHRFGYGGIFAFAFLESTFVPLPSEMTMVPAGYLVQQGHMNFWLVWLASVLGTVAGSYFNYWIAVHYGRRFLKAYGRYMFFPPEKMEWMERYFKSHGQISIFTGRLIPGVRHVISFPAGLAHMDLKKFCIYTTAGGSIWMLVLIVVGYAIGDNKELVHQYMPLITYVTLGVVATLAVLYTLRHKRKLKREQA